MFETVNEEMVLKCSRITAKDRSASKLSSEATARAKLPPRRLHSKSGQFAPSAELTAESQPHIELRFNKVKKRIKVSRGNTLPLDASSSLNADQIVMVCLMCPPISEQRARERIPNVQRQEGSLALQRSSRSGV